MARILDDVEKAELPKLFSEINQLRNQQFQITLAAVTLAAAGAGLIFPKSQESWIGWHRYATAVVMLIILGRLFLWLHVLTRMITRLSTYIEVRFGSRFEQHHAAFDRTENVPPNHRASQRGTMSKVFLFLGLFTSLMPLIPLLQGAKLAPQLGAVGLACALLFYILFLNHFGSTSGQVSRADLVQIWRQLIAPEGAQTPIAGAPPGPLDREAPPS